MVILRLYVYEVSSRSDPRDSTPSEFEKNNITAKIEAVFVELNKLTIEEIAESLRKFKLGAASLNQKKGERQTKETFLSLLDPEAPQYLQHYFRN